MCHQCIKIQICVCPNQDRRPIHVYLPNKLIKKWATHIGDDIPKQKYQYCVTRAVRKVYTTREHFSKCWKRYQRCARSNAEKYYLDDVFQRFCDADFAKKKGGNRERKLAFVRRFLEENDESDHSEVSYDYVCCCLYVVILMCEFHRVQECDRRQVCMHVRTHVWMSMYL